MKLPMLNNRGPHVTSKASNRRGKKKGNKSCTSFIVGLAIFGVFLREGSEFEAVTDVVAGMLSGEGVNAVWSMVSNPRIPSRQN